MDVVLAMRLPDGLWEIAAPLLPPPKPRPQGGGLRPISDRVVFTALTAAPTYYDRLAM